MLVRESKKLIQRSVGGHLISAPLIGPGTLIGLTLSLLLLVGLLFPQTFRPTAAPATEVAVEVSNSESWYISDFDAEQFEGWLAAQKSVVATAEPSPEINSPFPPRRSGSLTYEAMFKEIGARYGLDWRLLASVAYRESTLNPKALGGDNDMGLLQIIPDTWDLVAPELGLSDPFDCYSSALAGASFLAYLRDYFASLGYPDERYFLVAYNWGPRNVEDILNREGNWHDIPPANQQYAIKILELRNATFPPAMMERLQHLVEP
jgi:soluble lytic murein transglycosylase-like protein